MDYARSRPRALLILSIFAMAGCRSNLSVVVLWNDWGGWYDNHPPPHLDFRGPGIRVGCIIISPYDRIAPGATQGYVSHTQYEYGSILKFVEQVFGLPDRAGVDGIYRLARDQHRRRLRVSEASAKFRADFGTLFNGAFSERAALVRSAR